MIELTDEQIESAYSTTLKQGVMSYNRSNMKEALTEFISLLTLEQLKPLVEAKNARVVDWATPPV